MRGSKHCCFLDFLHNALAWDFVGVVIIIIIIIIIIVVVVVVIVIILTLKSQSLLVFFMCVSRVQTMHLGHQSPKSIFLFKY